MKLLFVTTAVLSGASKLSSKVAHFKIDSNVNEKISPRKLVIMRLLHLLARLPPVTHQSPLYAGKYVELCLIHSLTT